VAGSPNRPLEYFFGATGDGTWQKIVNGIADAYLK
jgi:hypothetical protein